MRAKGNAFGKVKTLKIGQSLKRIQAPENSMGKVQRLGTCQERYSPAQRETFMVKPCGNGYLLGQVEAMKDEDYQKYV